MHRSLLRNGACLVCRTTLPVLTPPHGGSNPSGHSVFAVIFDSGEDGPLQNCPGKDTIANIRVGQIRLDQIAFLEVCITQISSREVGSAALTPAKLAAPNSVPRKFPS